MNLEQLASWLFGRTPAGIRWGLERTRALLAEAGNPHHTFLSLHVGGTNGKGSVAALCAAALRAGGARRVGLYTSPHLVSFTERIQIDGRPIDAERVLAVAERLRPSIERSGATFFEATTAIAFLGMAESDVEMAVVEVGLGGRLDATNVLVPEATAITNVSLDHTEFLGGTLAEIAGEKAGIFKPGVPAITAADEPVVLDVLREAAEAAGSPLAVLREVAAIRELGTGLSGTHLRFGSNAWGEQELDLVLAGAFQAQNAVLAAELLALLPTDLRPRWTDVRSGFASVRWPGRMQIHRERGTTFLLDVAHNPAGVEVLCAALDDADLPRPLVALVGILADKDWRRMLPPLLRRVDTVLLTSPDSAPASRLWDPVAVAAMLQADSPTPIRGTAPLEAALECAVSLAAGGTVLITGSIHTVGDAMGHLGIVPYANPTGRVVD